MLEVDAGLARGDRGRSGLSVHLINYLLMADDCPVSDISCLYQIRKHELARIHHIKLAF